MTPKVGEKIYIRYPYNTRYAVYYVIGETSRSWLLTTDTLYCHHPRKLAKAGLKKGEWALGNEQDAKRAEWVSQHSYKIGERVRGERNPETVIAIAKLLGYDLTELEAL